MVSGFHIWQIAELVEQFRVDRRHLVLVPPYPPNTATNGPTTLRWPESRSRAIAVTCSSSRRSRKYRSAAAPGHYPKVRSILGEHAGPLEQRLRPFEQALLDLRCRSHGATIWGPRVLIGDTWGGLQTLMQALRWSTGRHCPAAVGTSW